MMIIIIIIIIIIVIIIIIIVIIIIVIIIIVIIIIIIRMGIFQGYSLSSLVFVIAKIQLRNIFRKVGLGYQTSKMAAKISSILHGLPQA